MSLVNNIVNSEAIATLLCTIVGGTEVHASANIAGNVLEASTNNEIMQTVGKILQSVTSAFLAIWATWNIAEIFGEISWEYMDVVDYTGLGLAGVVLSMPLVLHVAKNLSPENKEKIENLQKSYSTAIKIVNIATATIALGWFTLLGAQFITPIVLSGASLISSAYSLHKNAQSSVALKTL